MSFEEKKIINYHTVMKRILFVLAAAIPVLMGCTGKTKTLELADFKVTYPSSYELVDTEDCFPDDATFYFKGENGQISMNTVVYYSDAELEYLEGVYGSLDDFMENKLNELFDTFESGALFDGIVVEDTPDWYVVDNELHSITMYASGKWEDSDEEWWAGLMISLKGRGALVTCVAFSEEGESCGKDVDELLEVTNGMEFAPRSESYQPSAASQIPEAQE